MKKLAVDRFITKYFLSGTNEAVTWNASPTEVSTRFSSDDSTVIGTISTTEFTLPVGEYSLFETSRLSSLLRVLDDDITIDVITTNGKAASFRIKDSTGTQITSVLASPDVIPPVLNPKLIPPTDATITLDERFINTFIKGTGALREADTFVVSSTNGVVELIIGYEKATNTNQVNVAVDATSTSNFTPIHFSTEYLKNILMANKEAESGTLEISSKGIATIKFVIPGYTVRYFIAMQKK